MKPPKNLMIQPDDIESGERFLFNDRTVPVVAIATDEVGLYEGAIKVEYLVIADGPQGAEIWLQRTSTGRIRVKESAPYGAYANVTRLEKTND